jgi:hypothetical protein
MMVLSRITTTLSSPLPVGERCEPLQPKFIMLLGGD